MRKGVHSFKDRHVIVGYTMLLVVSILLIIGTILNWEVFVTTKNSSTIHYIVESKTSDDNKNLRLQGMNAASQDFNVSFFVHELPVNSNQLFAILDEHPYVIIVGNYVHSELDEFIQKAAKANIPVIMADYELNIDQVINIGVDQRLAGSMATRQLALLTEDKANIAIISFDEGGSSALRAMGIEQGLATYSSLNLKEYMRCAKDTGQCMEQLKRWISNDELDGIIALDAKSAEAVAELVDETNTKDNLQVVAFDRTNVLLEHLQEGNVDTLLVYNTFNLGYLSIQYGNQLANGHSIRDIHTIQTSIITTENMFWLQNQKLLFPLDR